VEETWVAVADVVVVAVNMVVDTEGKKQKGLLRQSLFPGIYLAWFDFICDRA
jgi:hypothetical protein